jgi:acyl carrier protein
MRPISHRRLAVSSTLTDPVLDLIAETLKLPLDQLDDGLAMGEVPQWDSVAHVNLIMALETEFGLKVTPETITQLTTVGAIRREIARLS